jgi:hypothetical protein
LEHFKKLQGNLEFYKNKCHPGSLLTRGSSVQMPLTSGPRGWPAGQTPWPAVDVSYAVLQAQRIVNVALHWEYSLGIIFIFLQRRKDLYHV